MKCYVATVNRDAGNIQWRQVGTFLHILRDSLTEYAIIVEDFADSHLHIFHSQDDVEIIDVHVRLSILRFRWHGTPD